MKIKLITANKNKLGAIFLFSQFLAFSLFAADSLSYSGRLVNSNGSPVPGPVTLRAELAYTNAPGTILCTEDIPAVVLTKGVFHIKLVFDCTSAGMQLTQVLAQTPAGESVAVRITDVTNGKAYPFQAIHSIPFSNLAEQIVQMGATTGQVLKWDGSKWAPGSAGGSGGGTVTSVSGTLPISVATGTSTPVVSISQANSTTNGYLSFTDWNTFNSKQGSIAAGNTAQYFRGDKSWQTLDTSAVPENVANLYYTNARVLGVPLSGFAPSSSAIVATDTTLQAFGKAQGQINDLASAGSTYLIKNGTDSISGVVNVNTIGALSIGYIPTNLTDATSKSYVDAQRDSRVAKAGDTMTGDLQVNTKIKLQDNGSNTVSLQAPTTISSSYVLKLPTALGSANQVLTTDASGNLSWTTPATSTAPSGSAGGDLSGTYPNPTVSNLPESRITNLVTDLAGKMSTTLTSGNILVGNASNVATSAAMSGDATLSNTGVLSLKNTGTAGTYTAVTTDAQGRVTSGSNISGTAPVTVTGTVVSMPEATTSENGYLKATDWTIFNNKQNALSKTSIQDLSKVRIYGSNATNYVELTATTLTANRSLIFPDSNGASGNVLTTDGAGNLTWSAQAAAPVTSVAGRTGAITLTSTDIAEGTRLYYTDVRAIAAPITAPTLTNSAIATSDTIQIAFGKLQAQVSARETTIIAGTTSQYLRGDKTLSTFATDVINATLSGFAVGTNATVAATDTLLGAFGKTQAQINGHTTSIGNKADVTNIAQTITALSVTGLQTPSVGSDAANKTYVDTQVATKQGTLSKTSIQDLSKVRIYGSNATNYVELTATTLTANRSLIFPDSNGASGNVLTTDGAGNLTWSAQAAAPVTSVAGRTGAITLTSTDIAEGTRLYYTDVRAIAAPITAPTLTNSAIATSDTIQIALGKLQAQFNNVLSVVLTGLSTATSSAITATDTILVALGKLQKQLTDLSSIDANKLSKNTPDSITATITVSGAGDIIVPSTPAGMTSAVNKTYVDSNTVANAGGAASVQIGTFADRPAASAGNTGRMYVTNDSGNEAVYVSTGSAWIKVASNGLSGTLDDTTAAGGTIVKRAPSGEVYGQYIVPVSTVTENAPCTLPTGTIAKDATGNILTCQ